MYAACLVFYDATRANVLARKPELLGCRAATCLCLISLNPLMDTLQQVTAGYALKLPSLSCFLHFSHKCFTAVAGA